MKKNKKDEKLPNDSSMEFDRRGFVKLLAGATVGVMCPVGGVLKLVIDKTIQKAEASTAALNSRNYVLFTITGGLPRWLWDDPITPNGSGDAFLANNMVKTNFKSGGALGFEAEYSTYSTHGYEMPYLWGLRVPSAAGGTRPIDDLLTNCLMIRGVNMEADNHAGGNMKLTMPVQGMFSLSGLSADSGKGLIPAITIKNSLSGASNAYRSAKGTGNYSIPDSDTNFLTSLFAAFQAANANTSFRNSTLVKEKVDAAIDILQNYANNNDHATDPVFRDRKKAEELFRGSLVGLSAGSFDTLVEKYNTMLDQIISNAKNGLIPGITSIPIPGIQFPLEVPGVNKKLIKFGRDLSDTQLNGNIYNFEGYLVGNPDVKSMFETATLKKMAKVFALAEFVLVNRLTNSLVCDMLDPLENLNLTNSPTCTSLSTTVDGMTTTNTSSTTIFDIPSASNFKNAKRALRNDSHAVGQVVNIMGFSVQYLGLSACLLELIDQLKATRYSTDTSDTRSIFDETVIQFGSDFDRLPDDTGAGSQHGWQGNSFTYFCGGIKSFKLVGNLYNGVNYPYGGTWGKGAPVAGVGQGGAAALIRPIHCANSICTLLRINSISTAEAPLIVVENDDIALAPGIELPKNKVG
jgi:hypothetical protein